MKTYKISELVGNTPLVEITRLNPNKKVRIFAKMEGHNPWWKRQGQSCIEYDPISY
jgi:cysteine synthase